MRIILISDTHNQHQSLTLPAGDMIIHAGDITGRGKQEEVEDFLVWFSRLPYSYKVFIGGNHDFLLERNPLIFEAMIPSNCIYLQHTAVEIAGIKIWGSPITPWFYDWAFNRNRGDQIKQYWDKIPEDTDILVTHGPPHGILDKTVRGDLAGCEELMKAVNRIKPKIHVFGHIHEAYGKLDSANTTFFNASVLDLRYRLSHEPHTVSWNQYENK